MYELNFKILFMALVLIMIALFMMPARAESPETDAVQAEVDAGITAYRAQDYEAALSLWRPHAEQGHAHAQYLMGVANNGGHGTERDPAAAVAWYQKAAEQDNLNAQYQLGWMIERGIGTTTDEPKAAEWYLRAAERGHARAQHDLGMMLASGRAGRQSRADAVFWYRQAAERGLAEAQHRLALSYDAGWVQMNKVDAALEAGKWWYKACRQGHSLSKRELASRKSVIDTFNAYSIREGLPDRLILNGDDVDCR